MVRSPILCCAVAASLLFAAAPAMVGQEAPPVAVPAAPAIEVDELMTLIGELQSQMNQLRGELDAEKTRSGALEEKVRALQSEVGKAVTREDVDGIGVAVKEVEGSLAAVKTSLDAQEETARAMEKLGADLEAQMAKAQAYRFGGTIRLRGVTFDNVWTMNDDLDYDNWEWYRMLTWLWFEAKPAEGLTAYVKLSNEFRYGDAEEANTLAAAGQRNAQYLYGNKQPYIENAYIDWKLPAAEDITLRLGRQNLMYGEGFVIFDGMPYIGSTGLSFDAIKATWKARPETSVDAFTGKFREGREAADDDEDLYGIYVTDTSFGKNKAEFYFLFRDKQAAEVYTMGDPGIANPARGQEIVTALLAGQAPPPFDDTNSMVDPEQKTYTLGTRWSGPITEALSYAGEIAGQTGKFKDGDGNDDRQGYAGYLRGTYALKDIAWKPAPYLAYAHYSGDDPDTDKYEGWDSLYADWPKYSELLIYTLYDPFFPLKRGNDPDVGSWTNMQLLRPGLTVAPTAKAKVDVSYSYILANEETGPGGGDKRGDLVQAILSYNFTEMLSGHLWGEWFSPGDYYLADADDAYFARWQILLNF